MRLLLIALLLTAVPSRVLAQSDLDLVTSVIPPNVMLLLDNSGSMAHAMWHDDFEPNAFHDSATVLAECDIGPIPAMVGSNGFCVGSGDSLDRCPDNARSFNSGTRITCTDASISGDCSAASSG